MCWCKVVLLIWKGIRSGVAYQATGNLWEAMKVFFGKEITSSQEAISSVFGCWIARNSNTTKLSDLEILFDEAEAQFEHLEETLKSLWRLALLQLWQLLVLYSVPYCPC